MIYTTYGAWPLVTYLTGTPQAFRGQCINKTLISINKSFFFLHLLRMGHEKRDCIALIGLVIVGLQRAQTKIASAPEGLSATRVPVPTKVAGHWWFNGRIFACHVGDPGPIPGQCKDSLLLSRMRACTISKNAQTSGAEAIFVWAQPWRDHSFFALWLPLFRDSRDNICS